MKKRNRKTISYSNDSGFSYTFLKPHSSEHFAILLYEDFSGDVQVETIHNSFDFGNRFGLDMLDNFSKL